MRELREITMWNGSAALTRCFAAAAEGSENYTNFFLEDMVDGGFFSYSGFYLLYAYIISLLVGVAVNFKSDERILHKGLYYYICRRDKEERRKDENTRNLNFYFLFVSFFLLDASSFCYAFSRFLYIYILIPFKLRIIEKSLIRI